MKTKLKAVYTYVFCAAALGIGSAFSLAGATFSDANWISMNPSIPGTSGTVSAAVVDTSGNLYIGGDFTVVGDILANHVAKWNGSSWSALPGLHVVAVYALAVSGSDVYAGGVFTMPGDVPASIAKWNGRSWTVLGSTMNGPVYALAVSGSELYAGGHFTTAGGNAASHIAKWDGNSWTALGSGMAGGGDFRGPTVYALALSGSNVYAGGDFTTAGGTAANSIAKWNGSDWSALGPGMAGLPGTYPLVYALAMSGSDVYVGGYFAKAGGTAANHIAKWDGSSWTALGSGMDAAVFALAVSGSDVYAGGYFWVAGVKHIGKWDGSSWTALGSGMNIGGGVFALAVSGSDLYAGGDFTTAGGNVSSYIARAYLLSLPALSVLHSGTDVMVSWPSVNTGGFALEQTGTVAAPATWVTNVASVTNDGTNKSVTIPTTNSPQFFRLRRP